MSVETILQIAYFVIAVGFGYYMAYLTYHGGARDIEAGSTGRALITWAAFGLGWPILLVFAILVLIFSTETWEKFGRLIFRG